MSMASEVRARVRRRQLGTVDALHLSLVKQCDKVCYEEDRYAELQEPDYRPGRGASSSWTERGRSTYLRHRAIRAGTARHTQAISDACGDRRLGSGALRC